MFVGCLSPDSIQTPLVQALPLADKPHLLRPNSRREELFGIPRQSLPSTSSMSSVYDRLPTHLALSLRTAGTTYAQSMPNISNMYNATSSAEKPSTSGESKDNPQQLIDTIVRSAASSVIVKPSDNSRQEGEKDQKEGAEKEVPAAQSVIVLAGTSEQATEAAIRDDQQHIISTKDTPEEPSESMADIGHAPV